MDFDEKILPTQPIQLSKYRGHSASARVVERCLDVNPDPLSQFELAAPSISLPALAAMSSSPVTLNLLSMLVKLTGARRILEIGTFVGLGAMTLARAGGPRCRVATIEPYDEAAYHARMNFALNGLDDRIDLFEMDGLAALGSSTWAKSRAPFDFAFVDGGKEHYAAYLDVLTPLLAPGAVIVVDDVFFDGDVLNDRPTTPKGWGCWDTLNAVRSSSSPYEPLLLPIGDGVLVLRKR